MYRTWEIPSPSAGHPRRPPFLMALLPDEGRSDIEKLSASSHNEAASSELQTLADDVQVKLNVEDGTALAAPAVSPSLPKASPTSSRSTASSPAHLRTMEKTPERRPIIVYSRKQLLKLSKSPLVRIPDGMPPLEEWFGSWAEQQTTSANSRNSAREPGEPLSGGGAVRERRFRRDPDDPDAASSGRTSFRTALTSQSAMGSFKLRSGNDRETEREGQERLRNLSDRYDRDRASGTTTSLRARDREAAPHLPTSGTSGKRVASGSSTNGTTSKQTASKDTDNDASTAGNRRKKANEAGDDWRRGADPIRAAASSGTSGRERDETQRSEQTSGRNDRSRRDRGGRDRDESGGAVNGRRDGGKEKDKEKEKDDDAPESNRRWRDRERGGEQGERDRNNRDRRRGGDKDHNRGDNEKEPAWMDDFEEEGADGAAGIIGGKRADGQLDQFQQWKQSMKERESAKIKTDTTTSTIEAPARTATEPLVLPPPPAVASPPAPVEDEISLIRRMILKANDDEPKAAPPPDEGPPPSLLQTMSEPPVAEAAPAPAAPATTVNTLEQFFTNPTGVTGPSQTPITPAAPRASRNDNDPMSFLLSSSARPTITTSTPSGTTVALASPIATFPSPLMNLDGDRPQQSRLLAFGNSQPPLQQQSQQPPQAQLQAQGQPPPRLSPRPPISTSPVQMRGSSPRSSVGLYSSDQPAPTSPTDSLDPTNRPPSQQSRFARFFENKPVGVGGSGGATAGLPQPTSIGSRGGIMSPSPLSGGMGQQSGGGLQSPIGSQPPFGGSAALGGTPLFADERKPQQHHFSPSLGGTSSSNGSQQRSMQDLMAMLQQSNRSPLSQMSNTSSSQGFGALQGLQPTQSRQQQYLQQQQQQQSTQPLSRPPRMDSFDEGRFAADGLVPGLRPAVNQQQQQLHQQQQRYAQPQPQLQHQHQLSGYDQTNAYLREAQQLDNAKRLQNLGIRTNISPGLHDSLGSPYGSDVPYSAGGGYSSGGRSMRADPLGGLGGTGQYPSRGAIPSQAEREYARQQQGLAGLGLGNSNSLSLEQQRRAHLLLQQQQQQQHQHQQQQQQAAERARYEAELRAQQQLQTGSMFPGQAPYGRMGDVLGGQRQGQSQARPDFGAQYGSGGGRSGGPSSNELMALLMGHRERQ